MGTEGARRRRLRTERFQGSAAPVRIAWRAPLWSEAVEEASSAARGTGAGRLDDDDRVRLRAMPSVVPVRARPPLG
jgi:hypothetical protein